MALSAPVLVLLAVFVILLLSNTPIAVSLGLSALLTIVAFKLAPLTFVAQATFGAADSFTLLAIPLFILAGSALGRTALADDLIDFARKLTGRLPGGLGIVTVVVGIFLAGCSGSGPADVAALGATLIPAMVASGYKRGFAAGIVASSGSIGIIIPPSIALIIYGVVAKASISRLFIAGVFPGIIVGATLILVTMLIAKRSGFGVNDDPPSRGEVFRAARQGIVALAVPIALLVCVYFEALSLTVAASLVLVNAIVMHCLGFRTIWGLMAPVIILGGIYGGVFTPTEAAGVVAAYALLVDLVVYRDLKWADFTSILHDAGRTSAAVMIIVCGASLFAWVLNTQGVAAASADALISLAGSRLVALLLVNLILLAAGCLIDPISVYYILTPILLPVMAQFNVDPVHFGLIMTVNLAIAQITPPVGVNLFAACAVGKCKLGEIIRPIWPFIAAELIALAIISLLPGTCLWLPDILGVK